MKTHHYGLATQSLEKSLLEFKKLGYEKIGDVIFDPLQGVNLLFIKNENDHLIEFVQPVNDKNPVSQIIKKNGTSLYHICYEIDNFEEKIRELKKQRFIQVIQPIPAIAFDNRKICFLYNSSIGLIELLEK
ncbi:VOC family protein [Limibacterium fermenti]|uniref:VOC family protein n=1 Tax=Limibacterium fermenti TaxID=3229863 RepID=UPI003A5F2C96